MSNKVSIASTSMRSLLSDVVSSWDKRERPASAVKPSIVEIFFYEWSDAMRMPRVFSRVEDLSLFLASCNIPFNIVDENTVRYLGKAYVSCEKGSTKLVVRSTWNDMRLAVDGQQTRLLLPY